jgi:hypothetical protein
VPSSLENSIQTILGGKTESSHCRGNCQHKEEGICHAEELLLGRKTHIYKNSHREANVAKLESGKKVIGESPEVVMSFLEDIRSDNCEE